jgi:hypothetical protein
VSTHRRGARAATPIACEGIGRERVAALVLSLAMALSAVLLVGPASAAAREPAPGLSTPHLLAAVDSGLRSIESGLRAVQAGLLSVEVGTGSVELATTDAEPPTRAIRLRPKAKPGPFALNLYSEGDFVSQQTPFWCISAAAQTMINIVEDGRPKRSKAFQRRLHFQARRLDERYDPFWEKVAGKQRWEKGLHGLGLRDWAGVLDARGYGPYEVERAPTRKQAIRKAAKAIRLTGRPAGLVVWRGAHAWVMSGFTATADPAYTSKYKVTSVFVSDPWYPSVSAIWGRSRPPNATVPVRALAADYLKYNRPGRSHPMRDGKFMLILPTLPSGTEIRTGA